jgi:hypothetical protein
MMAFLRPKHVAKILIYRQVADTQGVSRLYGITAGGDFLGLCDE